MVLCDVYFNDDQKLLEMFFIGGVLTELCLYMLSWTHQFGVSNRGVMLTTQDKHNLCCQIVGRTSGKFVDLGVGG